MSKRIRLAKYSRKITSCMACPCFHYDLSDSKAYCMVGIHAFPLNMEDTLGIPRECPLEEHI